LPAGAFLARRKGKNGVIDKGETVAFKLARLILVSACLISSILAIFWLILPFDLHLRQLIGTAHNIIVPVNVWPHVVATFLKFGGLWDGFYGAATVMTPDFLGLHRYPIAILIILCSFISVLLLRVSGKNKSAWTLGISLSTGAWFLAYTFIVRINLIVGKTWPGITLDYIAALCFALSLFYFSRFFTNYPVKLDFHECTLLTNSARLPKIARFEKLQLWFNRQEEYWAKKHPYLFFGPRGKPFEGQGTWAFYDSRTYMFLSGITALSSFFLWQNIDWQAGMSDILFLDKNFWLGFFATVPFIVLFILAGLNTYFKLKAQYHLGDEQARLQLDWIYLFAWFTAIIYGSLLSVFGFSDFLHQIGLITDPFESFRVFADSFVLFLFPILAMNGLLICILLSMFYKGAIDPNLLIRKSTVYTVIAIFMTMVFIGAEGVITSQAVVHLGMPTQSGAVIAGTVTALAFGPVRNRVEIKTNQFVDYMLPASALADGTRYEAVVVFNDLSGYTKMTEEDENKALTLASLFHKEGKKAAKAEKGRVVKTIGDAVLMEFLSADNAVRAITQFHEKYHMACDVLDLPHMPVHSGMHLGMVVKAPDGDIYGSTVNIAARLEGVAGPDEIVLSDAAKSKLQTDSLSLEAIGEQTLKNVPEPVPCFKVA
jgi:class 3 adenylate cyclase